ncbi:thioredoxin domain-containing protein [Labilibaculum sp. K2S]|uniref:thioredoxin family protein n=1 Tax=Labilibaculum sp. K2S TaxID=3056386 RepID=UPI0025A411A7|nr:thioredoxin domain-containing protein [Labilibaculum sp. K2S]MDM8158446.1 thioredoxin domain-containing protein [Labilibaculum sp. K2S]
MKKIILSLAALFVFAGAFSQGIEFEHGTFSEALAKAKKENKIVFMDCYTTWCGPCKMLAKNIFTQDEVGAFFNKNFVSVKMDMESEAGKPLMEKYQVSAFPTLLWLDAEGNIQHKMVGAGDANTLLETAGVALDTKNNWAALNKQFEKGNRSSEFMQKYIMTSTKAGIDTKEAVDSYFSSKKTEELINSEDAELIANVVTSVSDPIYVFVLKNKTKFYAVADKAQVDQFLEYTMLGEMAQLVRKGDLEALSLKKKELIALDKEVGTKMVAFLDMNMLQSDPDQEKFYQAMADYGIKYDFNNFQNLNQYAWTIAEAKEDLDKELVNKAVKMAKRSVELNANFENIDTYACILNKAGRKEDAIIQAKKSVELAPEDQKNDLWSAGFLNGKN